MRDEYDIKSLNPRRNPYVKKSKQQITINLDNDVVDYFKKMSTSYEIPYQTLINMYLLDCVTNKKQPYYQFNFMPNTPRYILP